MIDANLQKMRVVTEYGIHILRRNENLHLMPNYDLFMKEYEILCKKYYARIKSNILIGKTIKKDGKESYKTTLLKELQKNMD